MNCQRNGKKKKKKNQHKTPKSSKDSEKQSSTALMAGRKLPPMIHIMEEQKTP
jgi:hypothetical protein